MFKKYKVHPLSLVIYSNISPEYKNSVLKTLTNSNISSNGYSSRSEDRSYNNPISTDSPQTEIS